VKQHQGKVMEELGSRRGQLESMENDGMGRTLLRYVIATRGLMGFRPMFLSMTSGTGIMSFAARGYEPKISGELGKRKNGVLISKATGKAVGFALFNLQPRGRMFVAPNDPVYEGMVVGIHVRANDLTVNPLKEKKLTNVRASGTDEAITLSPAIRMTLEQCMEFIDDDELVEVTPEGLRVRKRLLTETERKRAR
jgi:GTP-binding protein